MKTLNHLRSICIVGVVIAMLSSVGCGNEGNTVIKPDEQTIEQQNALMEIYENRDNSEGVYE